MAQFKSWDSYRLFHLEVRSQRRYVRTPEAEEFLRGVAATCKVRLVTLDKGQRFWRAQLGNCWRASNDEVEAVAYPPSRMKPLQDNATEGRANPKGIPCLYLATTKVAAMSEVRPWIGAMVSVTEFEIVSPLTIVDCSRLHDEYFKLLLQQKIGEPHSPEKVVEIVWAAIDRAFSEPVTRSDNTADYAATQIIAELFRSNNYGGIAYKSAFGDEGYNLALFDLDSARQIGEVFLGITKHLNFEFDDD